jgi:hypothetical protein
MEFSLGNHLNARLNPLIVEHVLTRKGSNESVRPEPLFNLTLPHTLDLVGAESAIRKNGSHETDIITIRRARKIERLHDGTYFNSVFTFHKNIIAQGGEIYNRRNSCKINNLRAPLGTHILPVRKWCQGDQSCCQCCGIRSDSGNFPHARVCGEHRICRFQT